MAAISAFHDPRAQTPLVRLTSCVQVAQKAARHD
jgi:hypothetical protein